MEEILDYLNRKGEVVVECHTKNSDKEQYYIKIMAAPEGLDIIYIPVEK